MPAPAAVVNMAAPIAGKRLIQFGNAPSAPRVSERGRARTGAVRAIEESDMSRVTSTRLLFAATAAFALAGCETVAEEATEALGQEYVAMLAPGSGGSGSGKAEISLNDTSNMLCTDLELYGTVAMTAGHILGPGNAVIADIDVPDDNDSDDCDNVSDSAIDGIRENPGAYRVHIAATTGDLNGTLRREDFD